MFPPIFPAGFWPLAEAPAHQILDEVSPLWVNALSSLWAATPGQESAGADGRVKHTARAIVDLIEEGHQVVVAHGNGPQVGMINTAMTTLSREDPTHPMLLCPCVRP